MWTSRSCQAVALSGPYSDPVVHGRDSFGGCFAISATCEHPEEVFAFCDYLMSDEVGVLTWYGIEGVDYNIVVASMSSPTCI